MDEEKAREIKSQTVSQEDQHISLSSPEDSPSHSEHNSGGESGGHIHISLSPQEKSPSLPSSNRIPSPEAENSTSLKGDRVYEESKERRVAVEELTDFAAAKNDSRVSHGGSKRRSYIPSLSILRRVKRDETTKKAGLGFRILGFLFCLVSFAVMAADRNQGWALESFDHYIEFRYCFCVNMIGFVYCGAQALDLSYNFATQKRIFPLQQKFRRFFDFTVDQIIAYLLLSASSSATVRIDEWRLNWGKDKFPDMATASVTMSFLAFLTLASNSIISGYVLCAHRSL